MMQIPFKINSHPRQGLNQTEHTANANWDEKKSDNMQREKETEGKRARVKNKQNEGQFKTKIKARFSF